MSITVATFGRNDALDALVDLLDEGTDLPTGYIEIRTSPRASSPDVAATGTLLATLFFSNPAFGNASNGRAIANTITGDSNVNATGIASWFRFYDGDGNAILDGDITSIGGGGDLEFDIVDFVIGGQASITSYELEFPA